ncbi:MAG: tetratricopeptide repeat protein [Candidatus Methanospirareceae archaeon]
MEYYSKCLELDPKDVDAWNNKGFALYDLGRYEEAIRCYDKALEIDPRHERAKNNKKLAEEKLKEKSKPEIEVVLPEKTFKPNYWKRLNLIVRNKGNAHAKAVKIEFSKEVEVKGLKELNINSGEEKKLSIILKPNEVGDVPLEIKTTYKDANGKEYSAKNLFMLNVTEKPAEEPSNERMDKSL